MMTRQILFATILAVFCWTENSPGQFTEEGSQDGLRVQASVDPLPEGVIFPQWYRTNYEKEAYLNNDYIAKEGLLNDASGRETTEDDRDKAKQILNKMAHFLNAQDAVSFTLEYELNQQETMGAVSTGKKPFESFDIEFAKPNLLKASCTRNRNAKYRWEIGSDGQYLQRITNGNVTVEPVADSLTEMLRQKGTESGWSYYVNLREILSMFDPNAIAEQTWGRNPRYLGTRNFGSIDADYVIFDLSDDSVYQRFHLFVSKGKYPIPLMMIRDGDRVYSDNFPADDPKNKKRSLDTEWRFTDWKFNSPVKRESFKLSMPEKHTLVTLKSGNASTSKPPIMGKFVGSAIPKFIVYDDQGTTIQSDELLGDKPAILFFWHDEGQFYKNWREIVVAEDKFGADQIRAFAIYNNTRSKPQDAVEQLMSSLVDPEKLKEAGISTIPKMFATLRYRDRRVLQPQNYVVLSVCAVVDGSGKIVMQQPRYRGEFSNAVLKASDAILKGKDYIVEQEQAIEAFNQNQKNQKKEWDQKFKMSWEAK
ncbi:MAG: DUF2092 domain-containing protein [Planctomycetota bacterium]